MSQRVLLVQLDGKLPNVALMRAAAHHQDRGDTVWFRNLHVAEHGAPGARVLLKLLDCEAPPERGRDVTVAGRPVDLVPLEEFMVEIGGPPVAPAAIELLRGALVRRRCATCGGDRPYGERTEWVRAEDGDDAVYCCVGHMPRSPS